MDIVTSVPPIMQLTYLFPVVVLLYAVLATPFVTDSRTGVSYQGTLTDGVEQFQNIFFGQSTAGDRRFAPANTTINAT
jgi:hypothetical protein